MTIRYDEQGRRSRDFSDCLPRLREDAWEDWLVRGPRTLRWCLRHMGEHGGSPMAWHTRWLAMARLQPTDEMAIAHETACRVLQTLCCYDQVDVSNLAGCEIIGRQLQLVEERRYESLVRGQQSEAHASTDAHLFLGHQSSRGGLCISPLLDEWIAEELRKESATLKERRKAREERTLARPKQKPKAEG